MATEITHIIDPDMGSGYDYASLNAWEVAQQRDLVSDDEIAIATCRSTGGSADTTGVTLLGWTTDTTRYVKIWTDSSESYRQVSTYPSSGNKYRLEVAGKCLLLQIDYIEIAGISFKTTTNTECITVSSGSGEIEFHECFVWGVTNDVFGHRNDGHTITMWNVILLSDGSAEGVQAIVLNSNGTLNCYNVTAIAVDQAFGIFKAVATFNAINCIGKGDDCFYDDLGATISLDYCSSSDATADDFGGTGNRINQTFTFENEGSDDFRLAKNDAGAKEFGVSDPASGLFSDDIESSERYGKWDIGAYQFHEIDKISDISRNDISKINGISTIDIDKINGKEL